MTWFLEGLYNIFLKDVVAEIRWQFRSYPKNLGKGGVRRHRIPIIDEEPKQYGDEDPSN